MGVYDAAKKPKEISRKSPLMMSFGYHKNLQVLSVLAFGGDGL